jgi:hypothetical protein
MPTRRELRVIVAGRPFGALDPTDVAYALP